jgi:hypothetical protein
MRPAAVCKWWKCFRDGKTNVKTTCSTILKLAANSLQYVFEKWVGAL